MGKTNIVFGILVLVGVVVAAFFGWKVSSPPSKVTCRVLVEDGSDTLAIKTVDQEKFKAYYDRHYRCENGVLQVYASTLNKDPIAVKQLVVKFDDRAQPDRTVTNVDGSSYFWSYKVEEVGGEKGFVISVDARGLAKVEGVDTRIGEMINYLLGEFSVNQIGKDNQEYLILLAASLPKLSEMGLEVGLSE
jgi:hypothetical protein